MKYAARLLQLGAVATVGALGLSACSPSVQAHKDRGNGRTSSEFDTHRRSTVGGTASRPGAEELQQSGRVWRTARTRAADGKNYRSGHQTGGDESEEASKIGVRVAAVSEPKPDRQPAHLSPDYAEIVGATIKSKSGSFTFGLQFAGDLPKSMPDEETMLAVGFDIERAGQDFSIAGLATDDGWSATLRDEVHDSNTEIGFTLRSDRITFDVDYSTLGGGQPFEWSALGTWLQRTEDGNMVPKSYDPIPNEGRAAFPM